MKLEVISEYKKRMNITSQQLSQKSGVPLGTLNKILRGETKNPQISTLSAICQVINCPLSKITGKEEKSFITDENTQMFNDFLNLDEYGKGAVMAVMRAEIERVNKIKKTNSKNVRCYKTGIKDFLENSEYLLVNNAPDNADFAVEICDDSMSPKYKKNKVIFAKSVDKAPSGITGVFEFDKQLIIRKLENNMLIAENKNYPPILLIETEFEGIKGIVIE